MWFHDSKKFNEDLWESDFDIHIHNIRRNEFWGTNLEIISFSDLIRININMFTSLDQITPEFEINHPNNLSLIWIF